MKPLINAIEAQKRIHAKLPRAAVIGCPLDKCAGRILRQTVHADRPMPPFDRSMMDGYALRAAEAQTGATFTVTGTAPAGSSQIQLAKETSVCAEVMTGAILPEGADCVIPYEDTERINTQTIRITDPEPIQPGDFVHLEGSDVAEGATLLNPGTLLGSREIAAAASCGYTTLQVSKIPSIAIACSGDELVEVDQAPALHQIRRSNDYSVETALARAGLHADQRSHLPDERPLAEARLTDLIQNNDVVILSGGISKGNRDFIPELLDQLGLECQFHGVAQRPGKPMGFWSNDKTAVFALPGNPLSTLTATHHYIIPSIREAMGLQDPPAPAKVTLTASEKVPAKLTVFLPVTHEDNHQAAPCPAQNSGDLVRILQSDGYVEIPAGAAAEAGLQYSFYPWH
ncbi:MAG: molybdopterin molybdotransferase MoeA [Verrucomicrobiota bacterium]